MRPRLPVDGGRTVGKIIKPIIGVVLIFYLTYIGLGILFKGGETVVNRMEARAAKAREEAEIKVCEKAKLNFQKAPSEKLKKKA